MDCIGQKPLSALLAEKCEQCTDSEFIIFEDRDGRQTTITYGQFEVMVNNLLIVIIYSSFPLFVSRRLTQFVTDSICYTCWF